MSDILDDLGIASSPPPQGDLVPVASSRAVVPVDETVTIDLSVLADASSDVAEMAVWNGSPSLVEDEQGVVVRDRMLEELVSIHTALELLVKNSTLPPAVQGESRRGELQSLQLQEVREARKVRSSKGPEHSVDNPLYGVLTKNLDTSGLEKLEARLKNPFMLLDDAFNAAGGLVKKLIPKKLFTWQAGRDESIDESVRLVDEAVKERDAREAAKSKLSLSDSEPEDEGPLDMDLSEQLALYEDLDPLDYADLIPDEGVDPAESLSADDDFVFPDEVAGDDDFVFPDEVTGDDDFTSAPAVPPVFASSDIEDADFAVVGDGADGSSPADVFSTPYDYDGLDVPASDDGGGHVEDIFAEATDAEAANEANEAMADFLNDPEDSPFGEYYEEQNESRSTSFGLNVGGGLGVGLAAGGIGFAIGQAMPFLMEMVDPITTAVNTVCDVVKKVTGFIIDDIGPIFTRFLNVMVNIFEGVQQPLIRFLSAGLDLFSTILEKIGDMIADPGKFFAPVIEGLTVLGWTLDTAFSGVFGDSSTKKETAARRAIFYATGERLDYNDIAADDRYIELAKYAMTTGNKGSNITKGLKEELRDPEILGLVQKAIEADALQNIQVMDDGSVNVVYDVEIFDSYFSRKKIKEEQAQALARIEEERQIVETQLLIDGSSSAPLPSADTRSVPDLTAAASSASTAAATAPVTVHNETSVYNAAGVSVPYADAS